MATKVFVLALRENDGTNRLAKNLGVFTKRSLCMAFLIELAKTESRLKGGRFSFVNVGELEGRETEYDFNPGTFPIFENAFYKAEAELFFLK